MVEFKQVLQSNNKFIDVSTILSELEAIADVLVFGGAARAFVETRFKETPRDFDFVIDCKNNKGFDEILSKYNTKINRFGGYKITFKDTNVDIWKIENTWAFKNQKINCEPDSYVSKLCETTFLNIDSIVIDLKRNKTYDKKYQEFKKSKLLDVVLIDNPQTSLNIVRTMVFKSKYDIEYSKKLREICRNEYQNKRLTVESLYRLQFEHYKKAILSREFINDEIDILTKI